MVRGVVKLDPDAGDRGFGTATAANAGQTAARISVKANRNVTTRVFMNISRLVFKGDGGIIWPGWNDSAARTLIFIAKACSRMSSSCRMIPAAISLTLVRHAAVVLQNNFGVHVLQ